MIHQIDRFDRSAPSDAVVVILTHYARVNHDKRCRLAVPLIRNILKLTIPFISRSNMHCVYPKQPEVIPFM